MFALKAHRLVGFRSDGMDVGFPRERTCDVNTQIFFGGDALKLSTVQGVLVNQGGFFMGDSE